MKVTLALSSLLLYFFCGLAGALLWRDLEWTLRSHYEWQSLDFNRAGLSLRLFRRHLSVWQTLCRIRRLELSPSTELDALLASVPPYLHIFLPWNLTLLCMMQLELHRWEPCQPFSLEIIVLSLVRTQIWSDYSEGIGDSKQEKSEDCASIQKPGPAPNLLCLPTADTNHLVQEEGWRLKKNPSGCSQGLTTDSGGEVELLKGVSVETDFAFCWLHKPDIILCDIWLGILFSPAASACYAC